MAKIFFHAGFFPIALAGTSSLAEYQIQRHKKELELRSKIKKLSDLQERRDVKPLAGVLEEEEEEAGAEKCDPEHPLFQSVIKWNLPEMIHKGSPQKVGDFDGGGLPACARYEGHDACCTTLYFKRATQIMSHQAKMIRDTRNKMKKSYDTVFEKAMENEDDTFYQTVKETKEELEKAGAQSTVKSFFDGCQGDMLRFFSITSCMICDPGVEKYLVEETKLKVSKEHCEKLHKKCGKYPDKFNKLSDAFTKASDKFTDKSAQNKDTLRNLHGFLKRTAAALKSIAGHIQNYKERKDFCNHVAYEGYIFRPAWTSSGAFALNGRKRKGSNVDWDNGEDDDKMKRETKDYWKIGRKYKNTAPGADNSDPGSGSGMADRGGWKQEGNGDADIILDDGVNGCQNGGHLMRPKNGGEDFCRCPICWTEKRCEQASPVGPPYNQKFSVIYTEKPHPFLIRVCDNPFGGDENRITMSRIKFLPAPEGASGSYEYHDHRCQETTFEKSSEHFQFLDKLVASSDNSGFLRFDFTFVPKAAIGMYSVCYCAVWDSNKRRCGTGRGRKNIEDVQWQWSGTVDVEASPEVGYAIEAFQKKLGSTAESRGWDARFDGEGCGYGWFYSKFIGVKVVQKTLTIGDVKKNYVEFECPGKNPDGSDNRNPDFVRQVGPLAMKCEADENGANAVWYAADSLAGLDEDLRWTQWYGEPFNGQAPECSWKYLECRQSLNFIEHGVVSSQDGKVTYKCTEKDHEINVDGKWMNVKAWYKECDQVDGDDFVWKCSRDGKNFQEPLPLCQVEPRCKVRPPAPTDSSSSIQLSKGALIEQAVARSEIDPRGLIKIKNKASGSVAKSSLIQQGRAGLGNDVPLTGSGKDMRMPSKPAKTHLRIYQYEIMFADGGFKLDEDMLEEPDVEGVARKADKNEGGSAPIVPSAMLLWTLLAVAFLNA